MPRCGCQDSCSCLITAGPGITVEGIGTLERPYEVSSDSAELGSQLTFLDDGNVDFTVNGLGTPTSPMQVHASALLALTELTDVSATAPAEGQVPVWRTDHWAWEAQTGGSGVPPGGTTNQVLTKLSATSGDAGWKDPGNFGERTYAGSRAHGTATSIPNGAATPVPFDTAVTDDGIAWNGTDGFTVPVAGYYQIDAVVTFNFVASPVGVRGCIITTNGSAAQSVVIPAISASQVHSAVNTLVTKLAAGDVIRIAAYHTQGAALALSGNAAYTKVSIVKVPAPVVPGAAASGVWGAAPLNVYGADSLIGRETYVDSAGQLRVKPLVFDRANSSITATSPPTAYPRGISVMRVVSADNGAGSGWPDNGTYGHVETQVERDQLTAVQIWRRDTSSPNGQTVWQRTYAAGSWWPWQEISGSMDYCSVFATAVQSMATGTETIITFAAGAQDDPLGMWNGSDIITVRRDGLYQINLGYSFAGIAAAAGSRIVLWRLNGASDRSWALTGLISSQAMTGVITYLKAMTAGSTIQMRQYQSQGSALNTYNQSYPFLQVVRLGPKIN